MGAEYWANPMEDWEIKDGKLLCNTKGADRNVQLLTAQLGEKKGSFQMQVRFGLAESGEGSVGFRIGIQSEQTHLRA